MVMTVVVVMFANDKLSKSVSSSVAYRVQTGESVEAASANLCWAEAKDAVGVGACAGAGSESTSHNESCRQQTPLTYHRLSQQQMEVWSSCPITCIFCSGVVL